MLPDGLMPDVSKKYWRSYTSIWYLRLFYLAIGMLLAILIVCKGGIYLAHKNDFVFALFMMLTFGFGFKLIYGFSPTDIYESDVNPDLNFPIPQRKKDFFKLGLALGIALSLIGFLSYPFLPK